MEKKGAADEMCIVHSDDLAFSLIFKQEHFKKQKTNKKEPGPRSRLIRIHINSLNASLFSLRQIL